MSSVVMGPALIAFTGFVLLAGYLVVIATFTAGIRIGRKLERSDKKHSIERAS